MVTPPCLAKQLLYGPLAQWLERCLYTALGGGSSPSRTTVFLLTDFTVPCAETKSREGLRTRALLVC